MLLALTALFFALGFSTATLAGKDPASTRRGLAKFLCNLRCLLLSNNNTPSGLLEGLVSEMRSSLQSSHDTLRQWPSVEHEQALFTKQRVEESFEADSWQRRAYEDFKSTLLARDGPTFPCIYATMGFRANEHRYIFLDSDDPSETRNVRLLGPAMRTYLQEAKSLGANTSLVILCAPSEVVATVEDYNNRFWNFLRGLRYLDPKAWPTEVPTATAHENWTFCFEGEALFPIALTPAHDKRRSRFAANFTIAMQPKWVLDLLLGTREKRESATGKVRKLLKAYDNIDISPDLTQYGVPGTTESRQLCLLDENQPCECPFDDFDR